MRTYQSLDIYYWRRAQLSHSPTQKPCMGALWCLAAAGRHICYLAWCQRSHYIRIEATTIPTYATAFSLEIIIFLGPVRPKFYLSGDWLVKKTTCPTGQVVFDRYLSGAWRQLSGTTGQALMSRPVMVTSKGSGVDNVQKGYTFNC